MAAQLRNPYYAGDTSGMSMGQPMYYSPSSGTGPGPAGSEPGGFAGNPAPTGQTPQPSTGNTTELPKVDGPSGGPIPPSYGTTGGPSNGQSNSDYFLQLMNSGQYKNPQDAIDYFNRLHLNADKSGLSSNYGSSPAYYSGNNTIGLPGSYLVQGSDGKWTSVQRSPETGGGSGGGSTPSIDDLLKMYANGSQQTLSQPNPQPAAAPPISPTNSDLQSTLSDLIKSGGGFDMPAYQAELDAARGSINRQRNSQLATDRAVLASRGLIGSGPEATALSKLSENTANTFADANNQLFGQERQAADARLVQALQMATGMSENDARNAVQMAGISSNERVGMANVSSNNQRNLYDYLIGNRNADNMAAQIGNNFTLGQGQLAENNMNDVNNYNLGVANYGLNRDLAQNNLSNASIAQLIQLLQQRYGGASTSAGGFA